MGVFFSYKIGVENHYNQEVDKNFVQLNPKYIKSINNNKIHKIHKNNKIRSWKYYHQEDDVDKYRYLKKSQLTLILCDTEGPYWSGWK